jgi:5-bromo-4-chloroindolyl phosphate hydrolysis protein
MRRTIEIGITLAVIALIMALYACLPDKVESEEQLYQGIQLDEHFLRLDKDALEQAYKDHVRLLFSVWLKDDISVVHRINEGLRRGRRAYTDAATKLIEREKAIEAKRPR